MTKHLMPLVWVSAFWACSTDDMGEGRTRSFAVERIPDGMAAAPVDTGSPGIGASPINSSSPAGPSQVAQVAVAGSGSAPVCTDAMITPVVSPGVGSLLVIFDRSSSMNSPFQPGQTRLDAVNQALQSAIEPFLCPPTAVDQQACVEDLTVGAIMFPSGESGFGRGGMCLVDPLDSPTQINWLLATPFVEAWRAYWAGPNGTLFRGTPIPAAFQQADAAIMANDLPGATTVLFLTDGEANCDTGLDPVATAAAWQAQGINTYVVSVAPGMSAFNEQVAQAGGTDMSITPADTDTLTRTLLDILKTAVKPVDCRVTLSGSTIGNPAAACEKGRVLVGAQLLACDPDDGYQIRGPSELEVMGPACERLREGVHTLTAEFPCEVLVL